jgi:hypothetical protein
MKKGLFVAAAAMMICSAASVFANGGPTSGLGVGVNRGGPATSGVQVQYAINHDLHVGTQFGFRISDGTDITFAPYAKYFLAGTTVRPYAIGQFAISSRSTAGNTSTTGINLGGGAQYWFSDKFGVYGQVNVLEFPISPSGQDMSFGILTPSIGLELFF